MVAAGTLFVVATSIGNPADITARALETLARADLIACEDTRRTARILAAHGIRTPTVSCFEHNEQRRTPELLERLRFGAKVALVTDAGTPAISDPGFRLVRAAIEAGIRVTAVPGPSAVTAALSIAGIATDRFAFEGFIPTRAAARHTALEALAREPRTLVFFEAARRLADTLEAMATALGAERRAVVVREITKTHEETARGSLGELARRFRTSPALGEVTIIVAGADERAGGRIARADALTVEMLLQAGVKLADASAIVARLTGKSRREVYQQALKSRARAGS